MYDLFLSPLVMASALRLMTPVLFAAMGGSFGHKAKVLCLGLESFMAFAAFFAMYGSYTFENAYAGLLFGVLSAMIASCIFAVFVLIFKIHAGHRRYCPEPCSLGRNDVPSEHDL